MTYHHIRLRRAWERTQPGGELCGQWNSRVQDKTSKYFPSKLQQTFPWLDTHPGQWPGMSRPDEGKIIQHGGLIQSLHQHPTYSKEAFIKVTKIWHSSDTQCAVNLGAHCQIISKQIIIEMVPNQFVTTVKGLMGYSERGKNFLESCPGSGFAPPRP